jgi:SAM-dependent methyltransferase
VSDPQRPEPTSRADWITRYAAKRAHDAPPSRWIVERGHLLQPGSLVGDVAGGRGRHAVPFAENGHRVVLLDFVEEAVRSAIRRAPGIEGVVTDVQALAVRNHSFDAVIVVNFLDRELFPTLVALLKPGGHLLYETYTTEHAALVSAGVAHGPRTERFLLRQHELRTLVSPLTILAYREGEVNDEAGQRMCASIHAIKSPSHGSDPARLSGVIPR